MTYIFKKTELCNDFPVVPNEHNPLVLCCYYQRTSESNMKYDTTRAIYPYFINPQIPMELILRLHIHSFTNINSNHMKQSSIKLKPQRSIKKKNYTDSVLTSY